jgi:microcin C transport system substrate-binding protein
VVFAESDSPGNEQIGFWSSQSANETGGNNLAGVSSPVVDALVEKLCAAPDRESLKIIAHALDRVLLWGWYVVPHWYLQSVRVAYWDRFGRPGRAVRTGLAFDSWWVDPARAAKTDAARQAGLD